MNPNLLSQVEQIGTGAAFILFPLIFIFAFAVHPRLLRPRLLQPEEIIRRARRNKLLQLGHSLGLKLAMLLIVMGAGLTTIETDRLATSTWPSLPALAVLGAILLAADKGAMSLTMSALDTLPEEKFSAMMPGLLAIFSKKGWMILRLGDATPAARVCYSAVGLLHAGALPRWQSTLFLIGVMLVGTPDGLEIINLSASILMAIALVPYGIHLIASALLNFFGRTGREVIFPAFSTPMPITKEKEKC